MKNTKNCTHCSQLFESRRSNHVYCTASCKTKASYKRNNYKYVSGHYQKTEPTVKNRETLTASQDILNYIQSLEDKIAQLQVEKGVQKTGITEAAIGSAVSDTLIYAARKVFAPNNVPATKGDIEFVLQQLNKLHTLLKLNGIKKTPFHS